MFSNFQPEPDYPAALARLSQLTADELKELLNDDNKFEDIIKDVKQFKDLETEKEMLIVSNRSLAEFNLSQEPELEERKRQLIESSERGEKLCQNVEKIYSELKQNANSESPDTALALLQSAAAETEQESDAIVEKFLSREIDVDEFLEQFINKRKLMHLRHVKADKMEELISKGQATYQNITNPVLQSSHSSSYFPLPPINTAAPYPTGPWQMPTLHNVW